MREVNAIITISYRDFVKFLRDRTRIVATFIFPIIFIMVLGGSLQANLGDTVGYNFLVFVFLGVLAQTLFQSSASGIISLIEDKENDFSQEIFVSPISRYSIIVGKILGESLVAFVQGIGIILLGFVLRIPFTLTQLISLVPVGLLICILGGAFGVIVMANLSSQRAANQIFPFLLFPQFFLAGVFSPIKELPLYLLVLSRLAPMTYAVDFMRSVYYAGLPEFNKTVLYSTQLNLLVISAMTLVFITIGTILFIRNEKNR